MDHLLKGEGCETSVEHGLPLWAEPNKGYCSQRPHPSSTWGSRFLGARELGPWVDEPKHQGKTSFVGNPMPDMTYLPAYLEHGNKLQYPLFDLILETSKKGLCIHS